MTRAPAGRPVAAWQADSAATQRLVYEAWSAGDLYSARRLAREGCLAHPDDALLAEYDLRLALALSDGEGAATALARLQSHGPATSGASLGEDVARLLERDGDGARSVLAAQLACVLLASACVVVAWLALRAMQRQPPR